VLSKGQLRAAHGMIATLTLQSVVPVTEPKDHGRRREATEYLVMGAPT